MSGVEHLRRRTAAHAWGGAIWSYYVNIRNKRQQLDLTKPVYNTCLTKPVKSNTDLTKPVKSKTDLTKTVKSILAN